MLDHSRDKIFTIREACPETNPVLSKTVVAVAAVPIVVKVRHDLHLQHGRARIGGLGVYLNSSGVDGAATTFFLQLRTPAREVIAVS